MKTREEWMLHALKQISTTIFEDSYNIEGAQVSIGRPKKKTDLGECVIPDYESEDVENNSFPPTIFISPLIKHPQHIVLALVHEFIHAFVTRSAKHNKAFKLAAESVGFEGKLIDYQCGAELENKVMIITKNVNTAYGDYNGIAITPPAPKIKDETKKRSGITFFCPECGFELKTSEKNYKAHPGYPTCVCGTKMGIDNTDAESDASDNA